MNQRYYSLDVFRGATVALMILVNNPGSWGHIYTPLEHAPWHGCTPTDLVFPFFLFAVGNALAFVMPRLHAAGKPAFLKLVLKRATLIFIIGLLLNWAPFVRWQDDHLVFKSLYDVRIFGVLQRIALCYFFASLMVYFFSVRAAAVASIVLLLLYWLLCRVLGNAADPYSLEGFWGTHIDRALLGNNHIYKGEGVAFDPEGLASTMAAIVQVVAGYLAGRYIRLSGLVHQAKPETDTEKHYSMYKMLTTLFVTGCVLVGAGLCWDLAFPINKKIWTSSYVLYTSGLAINILAVMIYFIELRKYKSMLTRFFDVFGKNPLFIFVISGLLPRVLALIRIFDYVDITGKNVYLSPFGWFFKHICKPVFANPNNGSLLYAICMILFYWLIVYWLDRRKIYVRV